MPQTPAQAPASAGGEAEGADHGSEMGTRECCPREQGKGQDRDWQCCPASQDKRQPGISLSLVSNLRPLFAWQEKCPCASTRPWKAAHSGSMWAFPEGLRTNYPRARILLKVGPAFYVILVSDMMTGPAFWDVGNDTKELTHLLKMIP